MPHIQLRGQRKYQPGGVALASSIGESDEFVALRDYRAGDPMRRIHWRSWARVGRPVVREYQDEFFVRHALVLDTFAPPRPSTARAQRLAVWVPHVAMFVPSSRAIWNRVIGYSRRWPLRTTPLCNIRLGGE